MPILKTDKFKILFIHIPKTGGTSILSWFNSIGDVFFYETMIPQFMKVTPQHLSYHDIVSLIPYETFDYTFSIVRDPYARLESEYYFRTAKQYEKFGKRADFSNWCLTKLSNYSKNKFSLDNHLRPQSHFIEKGIDIFKYEDGLDKVSQKISRQFNIEEPKSLSHENQAIDKTDLTWSAELRLTMNEVYKDDFELFSYSIIKPL